MDKIFGPAYRAGTQRKAGQIYDDQEHPRFFIVESIYTVIKPSTGTSPDIELRIRLYIARRLRQIQGKGMLGATTGSQSRRYYRF